MAGNATSLRQPGTALFVSPKPKPHGSTATDALSPPEGTVLNGRASAPFAQNPLYADARSIAGCPNRTAVNPIINCQRCTKAGEGYETGLFLSTLLHQKL